MKLISLVSLSVLILLSTAACTNRSVRPQMPTEEPYTAPTAEIPIKVGYIPPFPTGKPKNEQEATLLFNAAADAYGKCIIELTEIVKQDEVIRGRR